MGALSAMRLLSEHFDRLVRSIDVPVLLEMLRRVEPLVYARYFKGFRAQTIGKKRVVEAMKREVLEKQNEPVSELLALLWNQKNRELYKEMLSLVRTIDENVEQIKAIEDDKAKEFISTLEARFSREDILICVRLNEVKFSEEAISTMLEGKAVKEEESQATEDEGEQG
jgi:hypothetical protein